MSLDLVSGSNEVGSDHFESLSFIESNLDSAVSFAVSQEIIVFNVRGDHMFHIGNFLHSGVVAILWETGEININDLLAICWLFVVTSGIMTQKVGSQSLLLFGSIWILSWDRYCFLFGIRVLWSPFLAALIWSITMVVKS